MHTLDETETARLGRLRTHRAKARQEQPASAAELTLGQRVADRVAIIMGSWRFIIIQSVVLAIWVALNVIAYAARWDPYPFILLNLVLSFQAAYAAPIIMMSQNRQQEIDRRDAASDYQINIKAELEIELLHQKIDALREQEVVSLTQAVQELSRLLQETRRP
ncbi:DUF1003 domain-containing protein [Sandarakinorhabdus sp.]|uniref:DUF1003 domain-containing protein n=1 Tax=Sandarakinorhabdus sp. TaxID=1916663 RepID=UPI0033413AA7